MHLKLHQVKIPFGGFVDFANGRRVGTDSMTLMKLGVVNDAPGWSLEPTSSKY